MNKISDSIKVFGALSVKTTVSIFFDDNGFWKDFYRDDEHIACAHYDANGNRDFLDIYHESNPVILTRAKGYRYWKKYFSGRICYSLPEELQIAIDLPCVSEGTFYDANGELCGYNG